MAFMHKIVVGSGITGTIAFLAYNQYKAPLSDLEKRNAKVHETALQNIKDKYTATKHAYALLQLPKFDAVLSSRQNEKLKDRSSYIVGYLQGKLQQKQSYSPSVFEIAPKQTLKGFHEGFNYVGPLNELHQSELRQKIEEGNYLRCKEVMPVIDRETHMKEDVLIVGTSDIRKCHRLGLNILSDAARVAAGMSSLSIDKEHPISDTPVFSAKQTGFQAEGDLSEMSETAKKAIRDNTFVVCNYFGTIKTRLSKSSFKDAGAILTGTEDSSKCLLLSLRKAGEILKTSEEDLEREENSISDR